MKKTIIIILMAILVLTISACTSDDVTVVADPGDGGTVEGGGKFSSGDEVTVSALPAPGWEFVSWVKNGKAVSEAADYSFVYEESVKLTAQFRQKQYSITATAQGEGSVDYTDNAGHGEQVTVQAEPAPGYRFVHWLQGSEVVSSQREFSFAAQGDSNLTAVFVPEEYALDIEIDGPGEVEEAWQFDPTGVTLKASAPAGYEFFGWLDRETGQEIGTDAELSFAWSGSRKLMARFRKEIVSTDGGSLAAVVGKSTTIGEYTPEDLVTLPDHLSAKNRQVRAKVAEALEEMYIAAQADGVKINVDSGYRSYSTQYNLFYRYASNDGILAAERYSARPGQSEHQLGTAVDFGGTSQDYTSAFFDTEQGQWLYENAHRFGFALSYPKDSEEITGYIYEPWHYRYVGKDLAQEWKDSGLTLIEFLQTKN